jgi:hypothetical protein
MKKIIFAFIPFLLIGLLAGQASAYGISIIVNGSQVSSDVPPQIVNGCTMVPVRVISEAIGANVSWDPDTQTVTLLDNGVHVAMTLGGYTLENGSPITLDNPAQIINGRVMVPIRFIAEAFGCQVNWDAANQAVEISSGSAEPQAPPSSPPSSSSTVTTPSQAQASQTTAQLEQAISAAQQNISDLNAQAQVSIENIKAQYDPQIQELQSEESAAEQQAATSGQGRGVGGGLSQYAQQQVENEYDPQIQGLQQQEQAAIDQVNLTLQQALSTQNAALANYQAELQQLTGQ